MQRKATPGERRNARQPGNHSIPALSESDLLSQVTQVAELLGWSWVHFRPARTAHGWRTPVSGPLGKGFPDLVMMRPRDRRILFVELKSARGKASPEQERIAMLLDQMGLPYVLLNPSGFDAFVEVLR